MSKVKKSPHPVDIHVGQRIKIRRIFIGLSQEKLSENLGLTFQQIQKYEKGSNRVSASKLYQIARVLNVSVSYFFEGLDLSDEKNEETQIVQKFIATSGAIALMQPFSEIKSGQIRANIVDLVRNLAGYKDKDSDEGVKIHTMTWL